MYKNVIFDLDGTLLNTLEDLAAATNWVCALHGWPAHTVEEYKYFVGNGAPKLLERVAPPGTVLTDELRRVTLAEFTERYNAHKEDRTTAYPGMPEAVRRLRDSGITLAVLSNKPHEETVNVIETLFGEGYFDIIQGQKEDVAIKPSPEGVFRILDQLGLEQKELVYLGDTATDMQTGKSAGAFTVGALWGFRDRAELEQGGADAIIGHPLELLGFV